MAIGQVKATGLPERRGSTFVAKSTAGLISDSVGAATEELGKAFAQFNISKEQLANDYTAKQRAHDLTFAQAEFIKWQAQDAEEYTLRTRGVSGEGGTVRGFADNEYASAQKRGEEFMSRIPQHLREQFTPKMAEYAAKRSIEALNFELAASDAADERAFGQSLVTLGTDMRAKKITPEKAAADLEVMLNSSALPEDRKAALRIAAKEQLERVLFSGEQEEWVKGLQEVRPADGKDIVLGGVDPYSRGALNAISAKESGGKYDVRWGGIGKPPGKITDFSDHPRIFEPGPEGPSSAAGRYQITATTWDGAVAALQKQGVVIQDFSPASQDRVALYLLETEFNSRAKAAGVPLTFEGIKANPTRENMLQIKKVLGPQMWHGLKAMKDEEFLAVMTGEAGVAGGTTPSATPIDVWDDPRFSNIPLEQKMALHNSVMTDVSSSLKAEAAARDERYKAIKADVYSRAYSGELSVADIPSLASTIPEWNSELEVEFRKGVEDYGNKRMSVNSYADNVSAGVIMTKDQWGTASDDMTGDAGRAALAQGDAEIGNSIRSRLTQQAWIGDKDRETLGSMLAGSQEQQQFALDILSSAYDINPNVLRQAGFNEDQVAQVENYNMFRDGEFSGPETVQRMQDAQRALAGKTPSQIMTESNKAFSDTMEDYDLVHETFGSAFDNLPFVSTDLSNSFGTRLALDADARKFFHQGYSMSGDPEAAKSYMTKKLQEQWGPSEFGAKGKVVKFPVEKFYPPIMGSHEWVDRAAWKQVAANGGSGYELAPDAQTLREIQEYNASGGDLNKLPSYPIFIETDMGLMPSAERFKPSAKDIENLQTREQKANDMSHAAAQVKAAEYELSLAKEEAAELSRIAKPTPELDAANERYDSLQLQVSEAQSAIETSSQEIAEAQAEIEWLRAESYRTSAGAFGSPFFAGEAEGDAATRIADLEKMIEQKTQAITEQEAQIPELQVQMQESQQQIEQTKVGAPVSLDDLDPEVKQRVLSAEEKVTQLKGAAAEKGVKSVPNVFWNDERLSAIADSPAFRNRVQNYMTRPPEGKKISFEEASVLALSDQLLMTFLFTPDEARAKAEEILKGKN